MLLEYTDLDRPAGNDLTAVVGMRYRLASDPDVVGSYTTVTATKTIGSLTVPYFDYTTLAPGVYVMHTYNIAEGLASGSKTEITVQDTAL
jgi:hypothetical protein